MTDIIKLDNGQVNVGIKLHGAELCSLRRGGREYLWGGDARYWKRHSPVLFPIVGQVWDGHYRSKGQTFSLGQHGLARDLDFTLLSQTDTEATFELRSSAVTLERYPYAFVLRIGYRLEGCAVRVIWEVENPADEEMAFQIGAHPAFYWPLLTDEDIAGGVDAMERRLAESDCRGYFHFETEEHLCPDGDIADSEAMEIIQAQTIVEKGCVGADADRDFVLHDGHLDLDTHTFDHDALIVHNPKVKAVTLCDDERRAYLRLSFSTPLVGLWSPPGKNAPFVCIEPWYGRTDTVGYDGAFEDKPYINRLTGHDVFRGEYVMEIM